MGIALDTYFGEARTTSQIVPHDTPAGDLVVVAYVGSGSPPTDNKGNTYRTLVASAGGGGRVPWVLAAALLTTPLVAATDLITFGSAVGGGAIQSASFAGMVAKQVSAYGVSTLAHTASGSGGDETVSTAPAAVATGDLVLALAVADGSVTSNSPHFDSPFVPVGAAAVQVNFDYYVPAPGGLVSATLPVASSGYFRFDHSLAIAAVRVRPRNASFML